MRDRRFLDTNILVYAFGAGDRRSAIAEALVSAGGIVGVQVLNEFTNVARKKLAWSWGQLDSALAVVEELLGPARPLTRDIHSRALRHARSHALPFYDALILAAAEDAECRWLISEDFQHGRRFGSVMVENPFRSVRGD